MTHSLFIFWIIGQNQIQKPNVLKQVEKGKKRLIDDSIILVRSDVKRKTTSSRIFYTYEHLQIKLENYTRKLYTFRNFVRFSVDFLRYFLQIFFKSFIVAPYFLANFLSIPNVWRLYTNNFFNHYSKTFRIIFPRNIFLLKIFLEFLQNIQF